MRFLLVRAQERAQVYATRKKMQKAMAVTAGPILAAVARIEAMPLRHQPGQPQSPMPAPPLHAVLDTAAQLATQARQDIP